jgi:hypothetical protein
MKVLYTTVMAQHRTRQQKITAEIHRQQTYSLADLTPDSTVQKSNTSVIRPSFQKPNTVQLITAETQSYLWQDLSKTLFALMVVVLSLAASWAVIQQVQLPLLTQLLTAMGVR